MRLSRWHRFGMGEDLSGARDPFLHLKESLGSLTFLWCRLDVALSDALWDGSGPAWHRSDGSFHERLVRLQALADSESQAEPTHVAEMADLLARLDRARRQRNLIVHSLTGLCADPALGEPHLTCRSNNGDRVVDVRVTQTALTAPLRDMDRCRWQLGLARARSGGPKAAERIEQ